MTAVSPPNLIRRALAEALGTCLLVCAVVGSGIAATQLSPNDVGLQLLENSLVTGGALVALIISLQPVSASFNPVVTLAEVVLSKLRLAEAGVLIVAQVIGGVIGTVLANLMFGATAVAWSNHHRASGPHLLAEVVATFGLLVVIFGTIRTRRLESVAYAVAGYIVAAYWFTSSTSFANPAVTIARMFSDSFSGIAPASAPAFIGMQLFGGLGAVLLIRFLHPYAEITDRADETATEGASA